MSRKNRARSAVPRHPEDGVFRIIGGQWRGRRLRFPSHPGVRPTGDRVRETLFNWLQPVITGARCLDLYAGSGALGLEALSRGARDVLFVDREASLMQAIRSHLRSLDAEGASCVCEPAEKFLRRTGRPFDLVFLDPPFGTADWSCLCTALADGGWLAAGARVYLEEAAEAPSPDLPEGWRIVRSAKAGNVRYHLASVPERSPAEAAEDK
jgi:16S rRNA (guanine966-N2)-methyltransferase